MKRSSLGIPGHVRPLEEKVPETYSAWRYAQQVKDAGNGYSQP